MADYRREKEHAFIRIGRDIKKGDIPSLVLLCGSEEYLIDWYTGALTDRYVSEVSRSMDLIVIQGDSLSAGAVREALETVSLMSERKVVLVPDFQPAAGKEDKRFPEDDIKELISLFSDIPEGSMLIMTVLESGKEKPRRKNRIKAAVEKHGRIYDFQSLDHAQLRSFIEKRFRHAGKRFSGSVTEYIISESGYGSRSVDYNLYMLDNDLKKIIAHCGASPEITAADVSGVLTSSPENDIFAMLDAVGRNRKDEAFSLLHDLLSSGTGVYNILAMITKQIELILTVKEMRDEGASLQQIHKATGIHQFRIKKANAVTGLYSVRHLKMILSGAYEVDENIKTGLMEEKLALEYFIAKI